MARISAHLINSMLIAYYSKTKSNSRSCFDDDLMPNNNHRRLLFFVAVGHWKITCKRLGDLLGDVDLSESEDMSVYIVTARRSR